MLINQRCNFRGKLIGKVVLAAWELMQFAAYAAILSSPDHLANQFFWCCYFGLTPVIAANADQSRWLQPSSMALCIFS